MLNDPFVVTQVEALVRNPDSAELQRFRGLALELAALHQASRDSLEVWKDMAHAIFNLKEFIFFE